MQFGMYICLEAHVINVKCMYTSAPGHIIDCIELKWGIQIDTPASHVHTN